MTARASLLLLGAGIAIGAATITSGSHAPARPLLAATAATVEHASPAPPPPRPPVAAVDPVVAIARAYALAARTWTAHTYLTAWRRQLALATGRYRDELRAARPSRAQLAALRADAASSTATVKRIKRDPHTRSPVARVLVWLSERTRAAGQTLTGTTRNEVRLRRESGGGWRVTGWTALPGREASG